MIKYHDVVQGTDEWRSLRSDKLTASNAATIAVAGKGLDTYCKSIVGNIVADLEESYESYDMKRGNELEPIARDYYELNYKVKVKEVGFITNSKYPNVGLSPDGIVQGYKGGIEIKARNNAKHTALILGDHKDLPIEQIQMSLLVAELDWWDSLSFNLNHSKPLFVVRVYPDLEYHEKLKKGFIKGSSLIETYLQEYRDYKLPKLF